MADQRNLAFGFSLDTGEINKDAQKIQSSLNVITDGFNRVDNSVTTSMTNLQNTMSELQDSINSLSSSIGSDLASQLKSIKFDDFTEKTSAIRKDLEELKKSFEGLEVGNNNQFSGIITTLATIKTELEKSFQQITEQAEKINRALLTIGNIGTNNTSIQAFDDLISDASIQKIEKLIELANKPVQSSWNIDSLVDGLVKLNATAQMVNQTVGNVTITNTSNNGSDVTKDMITSLEQVKTTMEGLNTAIGFDENRLASINRIRTELESLTHLDFTNLNDLVDKLKGLQQSLDSINFQAVAEKLTTFAKDANDVKFTGITEAIVTALQDQTINTAFTNLKERLKEIITQIQNFSPVVTNAETGKVENNTGIDALQEKMNKLLDANAVTSKVGEVNAALSNLGKTKTEGLDEIKTNIADTLNDSQIKPKIESIQTKIGDVGNVKTPGLEKIKASLDSTLNIEGVKRKVDEINTSLKALGEVAVSTMMGNIKDSIMDTLNKWLEEVKKVEDVAKGGKPKTTGTDESRESQVAERVSTTENLVSGRAIVQGYTEAGEKIRETVNEAGDIVSATVTHVGEGVVEAKKLLSTLQEATKELEKAQKEYANVLKDPNASLAKSERARDRYAEARENSEKAIRRVRTAMENPTENYDLSNLGKQTTDIENALKKLSDELDKFKSDISTLKNDLKADEEIEQINKLSATIKESYSELDKLKKKQEDSNITQERRNKLLADEERLREQIKNAEQELQKISDNISRQPQARKEATNALDEAKKSKEKYDQNVADSQSLKDSKRSNEEILAILERRKNLLTEIYQIHIAIAKNGGTATPEDQSDLASKREELAILKSEYEEKVKSLGIDTSSGQVAESLASIEERRTKLAKDLAEAKQKASQDKERENIETVVGILEKRKKLEQEINDIRVKLVSGKSVDESYDKQVLAQKEQELQVTKEQYSEQMRSLGVSQLQADVQAKISEIEQQRISNAERLKSAENVSTTEAVLKNYNEQAKLVEKITDLKIKQTLKGSNPVLEKELELYENQLTTLKEKLKTINQENLSEEQKKTIEEALVVLQEKERLGALKVDEAIKAQIPHLLTFSQVLEQVQIKLVRIGTQMVFRFFREQIREAIEYVTEFSNKLNEISIITGKSQSDVDALGESYRALAKTLKASSNDIATAAVTYFRQGLDDSEVNNRILATTQYAKAANISFSDASEKITASTNALGVSASRVADVFLYLGDHAATSGKQHCHAVA